MEKIKSNALENENAIIARLKDVYNWDIVPTSQFALIDGIAQRDGEVSHVVEMKTRWSSISKMRQFGTYLITNKKIEAGQLMSSMLRVPFIVIVQLLECNTMMAFQITDGFGNYMFEFQTKETETSAEIHGGVARRLNAFLPIDKAYLI